MVHPRRSLPPEVSTLVHHVTLHQAGWADKALSRLALSTLWLSDKPLSREQIRDSLTRHYHLSVTSSQVDPIIDSLKDENHLLEVSPGLFRLPAQVRDQIDGDIKNANASVEDVREHFQLLLHTYCPDLEPESVWTVFEQKFVVPMIRKIGANTCNLFSGNHLPVDPNHVERFITTFDHRFRRPLAEFSTAFLNPKEPTVLNYVGRLLYACLCVEAIALSEKVIATLTEATTRPLELRLFLDTNFLFSTLELDDSPSNVFARDLKDLLRKLPNGSRVAFYVTPETLDEARLALGRAKATVEQLPRAANFTSAALATVLSGLTKRFFTERQRRDASLSANSWFDPYMNDLVSILTSEGIDLHKNRSDHLSTRVDVVNDITQVMQYEEQHFPEYRRKSYEKIAHDLKLWHLVNDSRSSLIESPIDAHEWLLTLDSRLIGFDRSRLNREQTAVPICLHPASLIQLLRFWVPRTEKFDEAVLGELRLPFLFQEFDTEAEQLTLRIIGRLGDFEESHRFSPDLVLSVVMNEGLRARISSDLPEENEVQLIRDTYIAEITSEIDKERKKRRKLQEQILARNDALAKSGDQTRLQQLTIERLQEELAQSNAGSSRLKEQVCRIAGTERRYYLLLYCTVILVLLCLSVASVWLVIQFTNDYQGVALTARTSVLVRAMIGVGIFISLHWLFEFLVKGNTRLTRLLAYKRLSKLRRAIWIGIVSVISGALGSWISTAI